MPTCTQRPTYSETDVPNHAQPFQMDQVTDAHLFNNSNKTVLHSKKERHTDRVNYLHKTEREMGICFHVADRQERVKEIHNDECLHEREGEREGGKGLGGGVGVTDTREKRQTVRERK